MTRERPLPLAARRLACLATFTTGLLFAHDGAIAQSTGDGAIHPSQWPQVVWPFTADPALEAKVDALLATMTVEEKVGQTIQGDLASITPEDVRKYRLGSILAGGSSDPGGKYNAPPSAWLATADAFWEASMDTRGGGKAIPILWGIDAMHGQSNVVGATLFPHNIGLGATRNVELQRTIGRITAQETRATGMEWVFAPTVAVPRDVRWGRAYEGYSENPQLVASFAAAMVEGLQGKVGDADFLDDSRVMVSVKHFLGDGGTFEGRDQGDTRASEAVLRDIHGAGYTTALAAGAQSVMASFNSVHGTKLHGHKPLLTDVLKGRMNFGGFVVGDWNGHGQVPGCTATDCPATYVAGLDMPMASDSWKGMYDSTLAAVKDGRLPMARLDDAVRRILRVKFRMNLFDKPRPSERALGGQFALLGAPEHRAVARQAVRESLVLLKNRDGLLPLAANQRVLVAGDGADDMGKQSGGWTLNWQGTGTTRADYPNGTTIYEGLKQQIDAAGGQVELAIDGTYATRPDVAIVVFGENPYAEFQGDIPNLLYHPGDDRDLELIKRLKADGIPVVSLFITGRPLWMNREINASDAFAAIWLPGAEGAGVADVILRGADGKPRHDFKGKLSFSWPARAVQGSIDAKDYATLFAFGHGLTYADDGNLASLPEASGLAVAATDEGALIRRGAPRVGIVPRLVGADKALIDALHAPAVSPDRSLSVTALDFKAQEDARRIAWTGNGPASWELVSSTPADFERQTNGDILLTATLRVESVPDDGQVLLYAGSDGHARGELSIREQLAALPRNEWLSIAVPLKCLRAAGADMKRLHIPLGIQSAPGLTLSVHQIQLDTKADHRLDCAQP